MAGGTGFPLIDLAKLGHDVTYVDGSPTMQIRFLENARRGGLQLMPSNHLCRWGDISRRLDRRFDALLCRGNSLAYANTWRDERDPKTAGVLLESALADFYRLLTPGGWAYLDKYRSEPGAPAPGVNRFTAAVSYRGERWCLEWEVETLPMERKRIWRGACTNEASAARGSFELPSLLFTADDVARACRDVGFEAVRVLPCVAGEETFEVIEARRPTNRRVW